MSVTPEAQPGAALMCGAVNSAPWQPQLPQTASVGFMQHWNMKGAAWW